VRDKKLTEFNNVYMYSGRTDIHTQSWREHCTVHWASIKQDYGWTIGNDLFTPVSWNSCLPPSFECHYPTQQSQSGVQPYNYVTNKTDRLMLIHC
jgi:hypothetical protein